MPKQKLIDMTDDELAKQEEEQNLARIENSIDSVITEAKDVVKDLDEQLTDYCVISPEDRENKIFLMERRNLYLNKVDQWEEYKDRPYFGRMDLLRNGSEAEVFFIGEKGIADRSNVLVLDWRTPIGGAFANKQATHYSIKDNEYKLLLRRAVNIEKAKIINVHTEYDDSALSLDGEVIDPFLLSVLRDKRRDYKLTDIIRTIQSNQNELIRKPIGESFIVQGCAGSGKTMILLHRLSYIAFNYPNFNFARCCILTPNEYFNVHVDELSQKLGLDKIKRYSVEGFYATWIKFLGKNDTYFTDVAKKKTAIKAGPVPDHVSSEKLLSSEMLEEIYSKGFFDHFSVLYEGHWRQVLEKIENRNLSSVLVKTGKAVPNYHYHSYSSYSALKNTLSDIINTHSAAIRAFEKAQKNLEEADRQVMANTKSVKAISLALDNARHSFVSDLAESEKYCTDSLTSRRNAQAEAAQSINQAKADKLSAFSELKNIEESLSFIQKNGGELTEAAYLQSSNLEIARIIAEQCAEEIKTFETAEEQYNKVPFYNFGKRSRAKADMDAAADSLSRSVSKVVDAFKSEKAPKLADLRRRIADLDTAIAEANKILASSEHNKEIEKKLSIVQKCSSLFELEGFPEVERKLTAKELDLLPESRQNYLVSFRRKSEAEKMLRLAERQHSESLAALEKNQSNIIAPEDIDALKDALALTNQLDFTVFNALFEAELSAVYKKHGQKIRKDVTYRHKLLYKLLLCTFYYDFKTDTPYFINIDEAQDLAETEYLLLKRILGPRTTFNLYGDVNQLVYSYKGITQWDDLSDIISSNLYFLNENYRNTLQITSYCNKKFEADVLGVGLSGENVLSLPFKDAIAKLLRIKQEAAGCRAAVIYRKGLNKLPDAVADYADDIVFDQVDPKKISVITVEESKGLEFDAVVVIDSKMSMNEQYISYTRALDNLIITDLPGSDIDTDSIDESPEAEVIPNTESEEADREAVHTLSDIPDIEHTDAHEPMAELTDEAVSIRIADAAPYIAAFFEFDPNLKLPFLKLAESISSVTPDIMIRVSNQYIGFAKPDEKCRTYISLDNGEPFIKFKHLFAKEAFKDDQIDHYIKAYHQCCQYIDKYPDSIQMKKNS